MYPTSWSTCHVTELHLACSQMLGSARRNLSRQLSLGYSCIMNECGGGSGGVGADTNLGWESGA